MKITKTKMESSIKDHSSALLLAQSNNPKPTEIPIDNVILRIINLNTGIQIFWSDSEGWAPIEAAKLLQKSRLDWQVSLSNCMRMWVPKPTQENNAGHLILGWVNLASLVEGTMKLFLSIWLETYKNSEDKIVIRRGELQNPHGLQLEPMRQYFKKKIWDDTWDSWVQRVQQRRNAIHAYKHREIGTHDELLDEIREYLTFLRYVNIRLPYPDENYIPQEF